MREVVEGERKHLARYLSRVAFGGVCGAGCVSLRQCAEVCLVVLFKVRVAVEAERVGDCLASAMQESESEQLIEVSVLCIVHHRRRSGLSVPVPMTAMPRQLDLHDSSIASQSSHASPSSAAIHALIIRSQCFSTCALHSIVLPSCSLLTEHHAMPYTS